MKILNLLSWNTVLGAAFVSYMLSSSKRRLNGPIGGVTLENSCESLVGFGPLNTNKSVSLSCGSVVQLRYKDAELKVNKACL